MKMTKIISYIHFLGCIGWSIFGFYFLEDSYPYIYKSEAFVLFTLFATTASGIYLFIVGRKKQPENIKKPDAILMTIISYINLLGCIGWSIFGFYFLREELSIERTLALFALFATTASGIYLFTFRFIICRQDFVTKKLIILWAGTFVIVALCLGTLYTRYMDLARLIIQCAIVGLITGVLLYTLNAKKAEGGGK